MAIKLADTLAPMADFPAVEAKDVAFNDNKSLQEKYDNGELGGGGSSVTVDTSMSSTSTNPVQNKVIKAYVDGKSVDISADSDNAIQTKTDGIYVEKTKISTDDGNALSKKSNGLFVQDLSDKINQINFAQKTVNEGLDYCYCTLGDAISGQTYSVNDTFPFTMSKSNNMTCNSSNHSIILKKGKTYRISSDIQCNLTSSSIVISIYNLTKGMNLRSFHKTVKNTASESAGTAIYTPDLDDEEIIVKIISLSGTVKGTIKPTDFGYFIAEEIGRAITIDPLEYVNSESGIEDTPVGEIIKTLGNETPKHYLACDGSVYNIADYPHLAQYFKDNFGSSNAFGGDGTTTFAVPNYAIEKKLDTSPMASNAWASSIYSSKYAASKVFNGTLNITSNYWQTAENITLPVELGIDLESEYFITRYALHNLGWNTAAINNRPNTWDFEGSNDKINWNTIDTVTNYTWTNNTPEFKVSMPGSYRYYRWVIKTCVGTGVSGVPPIAPILNQILLYYTNSNFTHIKAEPTYFIGQINGNEYIEEILDKQSFNMTASGANSIGITKQFTKPITDFDKIEFAYSLSKIIETTKDYAGTYDGVPTNITYTNDNKGFVFNGTSSQIHLQDNAKTFPLTVEIVLSATSYKHNTLIYTDAPTGIAIGNWTSSKNSFICSVSKSNKYVVPSDFYNGTIRTLTVVYTTASNIEVYVDGVLLTTTDGTDTWELTGSGDSYIGKRATGSYFNGNIYGVRVYSRALSSSEVLQSHTDNIDYVVNNKPKVSRTNVIQEYDFRLDIENNKSSFHTTRTIRVDDIDYTTSMMLDITKPSTSNGIDSSAIFYNIKDKDNIEFEQTINRNSYSTSATTGFTQIHIDKVRGIRTINKIQSI